MQTPVALFVFNRPDLTRRVFERIRKVRPGKFLLIADGPRQGNANDSDKINAVRAILDQGIDWPCQVWRNYSDINLGCMDRMRSGLDWVFGLVDQAVILEDDCLPDVSFFGFCEKLLHRYKDEERVVNISGTNLIAPYYRARHSYWFSRHPWTWGWATWRRAWRHNDFEMSSWDSGESSLVSSFSTAWETQYWVSMFQQARRDLRAVDCWDFQWNFTCRSRDGISIIPRENMVENIGFDCDSTHAFEDARRLMLPAMGQSAESHPGDYRVDRYADELWTRVYSGMPVNLLGNLRSRLRVWKAELRCGQRES